jgi:hypothetical protein
MATAGAWALSLSAETASKPATTVAATPAAMILAAASPASPWLTDLGPTDVLFVMLISPLLWFAPGVLVVLGGDGPAGDPRLIRSRTRLGAEFRPPRA